MAPPPPRVSIKRVPGNEDLALPAYATPGAAGLDLPAAVGPGCVIKPGERTRVPTGFAIALPEGFEAQIRPRSGLAARTGLLIPNAPGTIDSDYRGEIQVLLWNAGPEEETLSRGDRIAQLVIAPVVQVELVPVDELPATERGDGGFGHTGQGAR